MHNEHSKYDEIEVKSRKEHSTKHNTQSINSNSTQGPQMVKIPLNELKKMYEQCRHYEEEVEVLQKELNFYRKTASKNNRNSVALALADWRSLKRGNLGLKNKAFWNFTLIWYFLSQFNHSFSQLINYLMDLKILNQKRTSKTVYFLIQCK